MKENTANFSAKVVGSWKELSVVERIKVKDYTNFRLLNNEVSEDGSPYNLDIVNLVEVATHNEKAEKQDYTVYVVETADGEFYYTSSESFARRLYDMREEFIAFGEEFPEVFECYACKQLSKNYRDKYMLLAYMR